MATPADQRLLDLLDKWLKSLELHLKYCSLDDESYRRIQPWPEHQRPSRWIIDLAKQKAQELRTQIEERVDRGDVKFSDSLELMTFLANLVGSEHIERFVPLADAGSERTLADAPPELLPGVPPEAAPDLGAVTREMPRLTLGSPRPPAPASTAEVARSERNVPTLEPEDLKPVPSRGVSPKPKAPVNAVHEQVIADAARLVQWGRKWYELAELIAGMADRPSLIDVRRILKDNKTVIDKKAGRG